MKPTKHKSRLDPKKVIFSAITHLMLVFVAVITLIPLIWMVVASFKTNQDFFTSLYLPPGDGLFGIGWDKLTISHYVNLFREIPFGRYMLNSVFIAGTISVVATLFAAMGGYALSKFQFRGQYVFMAIIFGALIVPPALLLAPGYQILYFLGLLDSHAGIILPGLAPAFGVFLFRQAMLNAIPKDLLECARIEGCNELQIFFMIVLPLVRPMVGAFVLLSFIGAWNNFVLPQIILQTQDLYPVALGIAQLRDIYNEDYGLIMAGTVMAIAPVMVLFFFLQKEFISGLTSGAVKG